MTTKTSPHLGIEPKQLDAIADGLATMLANTYTLYVTTQGYHWNVTGPHFHSLHEMFEEQYIDLREAADDIAERIRALGRTAPGSLAEYSRLTSLEDGPAALDADAMVENLVTGNETIARLSRALVATAEEAGDVATADLVTARIQQHEKTAWMLRSTVA